MHEALLRLGVMYSWYTRQGDPHEGQLEMACSPMNTI